MKMKLLSAGLATIIATGFVATSARADDVLNSGHAIHATKMKPAAIKRMKKDGAARKDSSKNDYYTSEREKMMKISM